MNNDTRCHCFPHTWSPARMVQHLHEIEVIDPTCRYHAHAYQETNR